MLRVINLSLFTLETQKLLLITDSPKDISFLCEQDLNIVTGRV